MARKRGEHEDQTKESIWLTSFQERRQSKTQDMTAHSELQPIKCVGMCEHLVVLLLICRCWQSQIIRRVQASKVERPVLASNFRKEAREFKLPGMDVEALHERSKRSLSCIRRETSQLALGCSKQGRKDAFGTPGVTMTGKVVQECYLIWV